jgi:hypothetical protein
MAKGAVDMSIKAARILAFGEWLKKKYKKIK